MHEIQIHSSGTVNTGECLSLLDNHFMWQFLIATIERTIFWTSQWLYLDFHGGNLMGSFLFYTCSSDLFFFLFSCLLPTPLPAPKKRSEGKYILYFLVTDVESLSQIPREAKATRNRITASRIWIAVWHHVAEFIKFIPFLCRANRSRRQFPPLVLAVLVPCSFTPWAKSSFTHCFYTRKPIGKSMASRIWSSAYFFLLQMCFC